MLNKTAYSIIVALLTSGALAGPCSATTIFDFQYSIPAPDASFDSVWASGTLTADGVPGNYIITAITGTRVVNGVPEAITGLIDPGGYKGNTNRLYYPNTPLLDDGGLSFTVAGPGDHWDGNVILYSMTDYMGTLYSESGPSWWWGDFSVTEATAPEPSTIVLLTFGAAGLGLWTRIRRASRRRGTL